MIAPPLKRDIEQLIRLVSKQYGVDPEKSLRQCWKESRFRPNAVNSRSMCIGLFQLAPKTAEKDLGVREPKVRLLDWRINTDAAMRYMQRLLKQYSGDYYRAYAAYNWGMGNLDHCEKLHAAEWRSHLPDETRDYVEFILGQSPMTD